MKVYRHNENEGPTGRVLVDSQSKYARRRRVQSNVRSNMAQLEVSVLDERTGHTRVAVTRHIVVLRALDVEIMFRRRDRDHGIRLVAVKLIETAQTPLVHRLVGHYV